MVYVGKLTDNNYHNPDYECNLLFLEKKSDCQVTLQL